MYIFNIFNWRFRYLLNKGCNPNIKAHDGLDPLMAAVEAGDIDTVSLLLEHGADPKTMTKLTTPLYIAKDKGHSEMAELLVQKGAPLEPGFFWKLRRSILIRWSNMSCVWWQRKGIPNIIFEKWMMTIEYPELFLKNVNWSRRSTLYLHSRSLWLRRAEYPRTFLKIFKIWE